MMRRRFANWLYWRLMSIAGSRQPDFIIGTDADPYMKRWWVIPRNRVFNIYLHQFLHSDDDRALHDHPWWNASFLLHGTYVEHTIEAGGVNKRQRYQAGDLKIRRAKAAHRVELTHGDCWSLFVTGPVVRRWGFHCPKSWRHWTVFTDARDYGKIGIGCGEHGDSVTDGRLPPRVALLNHLKAKPNTEPYQAAMARVAALDTEIADYGSLAHNKTPSQQGGSSV